jgi:hypothetical protein
MIKRFYAWLTDANGWRGLRFDPEPTYNGQIIKLSITFFDNGVNNYDIWRVG